MSDESPVSHSIERKRSLRRQRRGVRDADRVIARLADAQHGVVASRQLREAGLGEGQIRGRVGRGQLHRLHQGVYAVGHRQIGLDGKQMGAVLAAGPGAALSHRSAGHAWGLLRAWTHPIEVTRATGWRSRHGVRAHKGLLLSDEVAAIDGIPMTGLSRTLLDLATIVSRPQLERAMSQAEVLGLTDRISLPGLLGRYPGRRGSAVVRAILENEEPIRGVPANDFEDTFSALIDTYRLPRPRFNADLHLRGRFIRPDALWERNKVIVELDGRATHATPLAFEKDRERDRLLLVDGWRVIRVTWRQLRDEPAEVAADLRRVLRGS